jgi:hypothetical protein
VWLSEYTVKLTNWTSVHVCITEEGHCLHYHAVSPIDVIFRKSPVFCTKTLRSDLDVGLLTVRHPKPIPLWNRQSLAKKQMIWYHHHHYHTLQPAVSQWPRMGTELQLAIDRSGMTACGDTTMHDWSTRTHYRQECSRTNNETWNRPHRQTTASGWARHYFPVKLK